MRVPSPARMYDALLGGWHNFEVDRQAAAQATKMVPDLPQLAISNRAFLRRAVRYLVDAGIRQFIDIGAGIPTVGNTHEVAQAADPSCKVVYVDIDPVAVSHARAILTDNPLVMAIEGDARTPGQILDDERLHSLIDLTQPVGVLLAAVLHLLTDDDDPAGVVVSLRDAVAPGSYLVISHLSSAQRPAEAAQLTSHSSQRTRVPIIFRSREQIEALFTGLKVIDPGIVELPAWRPDEDLAPEGLGRSLGLAGVGRKD